MLINHLQEIYSLRYGMRCKQEIKHLLQMVNIRENKNKQHFSMLKIIFAVFTKFKQLVDHHLTTLIILVEDLYHC